MRALAVAGLVAIPALWFVIPGLTSKSWFISGDLALNQHTVIHGNKIVGVLSRWRSLYELPMQLAAIAGVAIALVRRDRATLGLTGAALLWVVVEMAFALHGWSAVPRYLIEPAAVMIVVAGAGVGQLLAGVPALGARGGRALRVALGVLGPVAVVVLLVALVPTARDRAHVWRAEIPQARGDGKVIDRLSDAVADAGGRAAVLACGKPVALNQHQSQLAWAMNLNVAEVGYRPGKQIRSGRPIVVFKQERSGWEVRPYNEPPAQAGRCERSDDPPNVGCAPARGSGRTPCSAWTTTPAARTAQAMSSPAGPITRAVTPGDLARRSATAPGSRVARHVRRSGAVDSPAGCRLAVCRFSPSFQAFSERTSR
jgi:hypothetical protein